MTDHCYPDEWKTSMDLVHENSAEEWLVERNPNFISLLFKQTLKDQEMFPKCMFSCSLQTSLTPSQWCSVIKEMSARVSHSENLSKFCEHWHLCTAIQPLQPFLLKCLPDEYVNVLKNKKYK